jgi:hypothetical protein
MEQFTETVQVKKGDSITIQAQGYTFTGTVISADFYNETGYYIEFSTPTSYHYWKQRYDGGKIVALNGVNV